MALVDTRLPEPQAETSWRLSMPGSPSRKRNWSCPECAKAYEWEWQKVSVSIAPGGGASSEAAPPAHAIAGSPLAGHPASGGESSSPLAAMIDELQAEVQKLKGKVAELRAEVDELKVRDGLSHLDVPSLEDVRRMLQELAAEVGGNRPSTILFEEMD